MLSKDKYVLLTLFLVVLSTLSIWRPWVPVDERAENTMGVVSHFTRGLNFGVDIVGGSRIILALEASHLTIHLPPDDPENKYRKVCELLEDRLFTRVLPVDAEGKLISSGLPYDPVTNIAIIEIGLPATGGVLSSIENLIGDLVEIVKIENAVCGDTRDEVIEILKNRVDPTGTRGAVLKSLGANLVLYEIPELTPQEAEVLLGRRGELEIFFENQRVLQGGDIIRVDPPHPSLEKTNTVELPFRLTDDGAERFRNAAAGKPNYPTVVYVDRPKDGVILFDESILDHLHRFTYDSSAYMFKATGMPSEGGGYYLQVPAVGTPKDALSTDALRFLEAQSGIKLRILLIGEFSQRVIGSIPKGYSVENVARLTEVEDWIKQACGCESVITISPALAQEFAEGKVVRDLEITITRASVEEAMREAKNLRTILTQTLPVSISIEGETAIEPRLGSMFFKEIVWAGIISLVGVGLVIYLRYRWLRISLAIMGAMICELIITLGIASVLPYNMDLAELGGVILVIGTGVDSQIIITDELMREMIPFVRRPSMTERIKRAFRVIWGSALTTLVAMIALATLGFGAMRGFAIITLLGILVSVLITRPFYARVASNIIPGKSSMG